MQLLRDILDAPVADAVGELAQDSSDGGGTGFAGLPVGPVRLVLVGAGGLGQMLAFHMGLFQMNETSTVLIAMIALVALVDSLSYLTRRNLAR